MKADDHATDPKDLDLGFETIIVHCNLALRDLKSDCFTFHVQVKKYSPLSLAKVHKTLYSLRWFMDTDGILGIFMI